MAKTKTYKVELLPSNESGAKRTAWRAGRQFVVKESQVLELTKGEAEVYENDRRFTITETEARSEEQSSETASDSEVDTSTADSETSEEDTSTEDSSSEDSDSSDTEEVSDEDTESQVESEEVSVDQLVKDNSREELNALALETGIENPDSLKDKTEVAQAIVDAKASNPAEEATS